MLNRETVLEAFRHLSDRLGRRGVVGELNLLGGTAMVLGFQARQSTKDVDAIFAPARIIREEAKAVGEEMNLPADWLNDAAKGFLSPRAEFRNLDDVDFPNLRVQVPTAEYLLAMKVIAARAGLGGESSDKEDIRFLIRRLRLPSAQHVMELVQKYYNPSQMLPRTMYLVEEIFSEDGGG
jgi:hypothetical protein